MAKFPWGDEAMSIPITFVINMITALLLGVLLAFTGPESAVGVAATTEELRPVAVVTCVFFVMWYIFLGNQVGVKFTQGLPADVSAAAKDIADRTVGNMLEQVIPFLTLMWLEAIFVNPRTATILGWIYVAARFLYPIAYGIYGVFTILVMFATMPNYTIISYWLLTVFFKCFFSVDLHAKINATSPWLMLLFLPACGLCSFIAFLLLAKPTTSLIIAGAKKEKGFDAEEGYGEIDEE